MFGLLLTMRLKAILFDLDGTLVLTDALDCYRVKRQWRLCYERFPLTTLPPETSRFVNSLRQVWLAGIVTNAPRTYAQGLLRFHKLTLDVLVAYHDVVRRKPHPDPIIAACSRLGISPAECVYIGDREEDAVAARGAGAIPILVDWSSADQIGRVDVCTSWENVEQQIKSIR
jgi:HAD superfamily hydrolase (TIGR01509 family)